jgi:predicted SPOUT superfamily RNA methylase MTH1
LGLLGRKLGIAIPDTVLEENGSLREKSVKLGTIARACAIYGVDVVQVFKDDKGRGESKLVKKVLEYLETPQYLRRKIFPLDEALRYAGLLPPLRIPSHKAKVPVEKLTVGEVREGVTNADGGVDVGLDRPLRMRDRIGANRRVTVKVVSKDPVVVELIKREDVHEYWGYSVEIRSLEEVTSDARFGLKIATSRYGNSLQSQIFLLRESLQRASSALLLFGSPSRGLFDMIGPDLTKKANFVLNLFADQHVETVRTEEAIFAALNLVNALAV